VNLKEAIVKRFLPVLGLLSGIAFQPALADDACLNPHFSYRAQPAGLHDLVAENTIGSHVTKVHITTSCIDLHDADVISLNTAFGCLGRGDDVVATSIGGRRQRCIVTNIAPVAPQHS
jgi:hypothetical protein